ncbi:MAG: nucleotide exchange factor GrpE [Bacteroidetes bacterium]|nr:nucleotide exchange factor GrpE [Bacteroidota bacterium]
MKDYTKKDIENQGDNEQNGSIDIENNANVAGGEEFAEQMSDTTGEKLQAELSDQKEKYLRLYAEFDNYKRRTSKERIELMQTAGKEVIISLLDVLDDCDRAERQIEESGEKNAVNEGVQLVFNKLRTILFAKGLKPMDCIGKDFDPDHEEAISQVPVQDETLKGKVIDEIVKGYYMNDKIIRFAKVVVGQ